jgi:opacity protein-like surface antigen
MTYGQSVPSAFHAGQSFWVGGEYANFQAGFPQGSSTRLTAIGVFANYNWNHALGVEGHARFFSFGGWQGEAEQDYLAGPRYTFLHNNTWRPFASFEAGLVKMQYPYSIGSQSFFTMAPGGGLEYRVNRKWRLRAAFEYQILSNSPNFVGEPQYGIKPMGGMAGISYRLF